MKKAEFCNIYPEFFSKELNQKNQQCLFVFKNNQRHYSQKFLLVLAKLTKIEAKIPEKVNKNNVNSLYFSHKFIPR